MAVNLRALGAALRGLSPAQRALRALPPPTGRDADEILEMLRRQKIKHYRPWGLPGYDAAMRQHGRARSVDELESGGFTPKPGMEKTSAFRLPNLEKLHTPAIGGSAFQRWTGTNRAGVSAIPRALTGAGTRGGRWIHAGLAGLAAGGGLSAAVDTVDRTNAAVAKMVGAQLGVPAERVAEYTPRMLLRSLDIRNPANRALLRFYASEALRQAKTTPRFKDYTANWHRAAQLPGVVGDTLQRHAIATAGLWADPRAVSLRELGKRLATTSLDDLKDSAPYRTAADVVGDVRARWQQ
jgi:hypothetical protein